MDFNVDDYELMPGVATVGGYSIPDEYFWYLWQKMVGAGIDKVVFYSGRVKDAVGFATFMKFHTMPIVVVKKEDKVPVGVGWLTDAQDNRAFAHYAFLPEVWGNAKELGLMLQDFVFEMDSVELLLGIVPEWNKFAQGFTEKTGGVKLGTIPNICLSHTGEYGPGVLYYFTREIRDGRR